MNPSTALARVLVDELVRGGVREAVLSPGSRSAPLAFALHDADRAGRLRLHVRIDERSAAFLALGLAKEAGRPVPVLTTSGTATANLHPAVLEASQSELPLLLLTADRPPELRGTGANQTVDQVHLYGGAVRLFAEVGTPEQRVGQNAYWRALTCRALAAAAGDLGTAAGPVHLNLGLREPLVPEDGEWVEPLDGRAGGAPWTARVAVEEPCPVDDLPSRTVVVLGDCGSELSRAALHLATVRGFPVVAEPSASAGADGPVVPAAELLLGAPGWLDGHAPARVLVVGRPTLSRVVARLVGVAPADVVGAHGHWSDPARRATRVLPGVPAPDGPVDPGWLPQWLAAGRAARAAADSVLDTSTLSEPAVAAAALAAAGSLLVVGSSKPVRDLFLAGGREGVRVLANRGAAGIDGTVSTAVGAALAHGRPTVALLGDLTFLHDANGLVLGPDEPRPDLTIVVVNNDGGAIFGLLEQGSPDHAQAFERVFGTPHGVDLAALCAATGTSYERASTRAELTAALAGTGGLRVVEVRTDRAAAVELDRAVRAAVAAALS
jgi:2-succinyl-5-enolpyruvyl-6-hydroxy-3-cyclohexene-1-carboxylate synthase